MLSVKNLTVTLSDAPKSEEGFKLSSASFIANRGAITAIVGPSGSGKSTLLKLISGQLMHNAGEIFLGDTCLTNLPYGKRGTATVDQESTLLPHLTASENIEIVAPKEKRGEYDFIKKLYSLLDITHLANRRVDGLSTGERQRVAIARAIASRRDILLLDEPSAALDMLNVDRLQDVLRRLTDEYSSLITVIVTHDRQLVENIADFVVVLDRGRILQSGRRSDVFKTPSSKKVAEIVGGYLSLGGISCGERMFLRNTNGKPGADITPQCATDIFHQGSYDLVLPLSSIKLRKTKYTDGQLTATIRDIREISGHSIACYLDIFGKIIRLVWCPK